MRSTVVAMLLTATVAALLLLVTAPPSAPAGPAPANDEPLAVRVREAIDKGKAFLRRQASNGTWDYRDKFSGRQYPTGGTVSLALLAMLTCGDSGDDREAVEAGLKVLRGISAHPRDGSETYVVSLQTMVYALKGDKSDLDAIKANAAWLLGARMPNGYWSYKYKSGGDGDASNTQYALLALHEAVRAGAVVDKKDLQSIQKFYLDEQRPDGSWSYDDTEPPSMTMTTAGLCGLLITGMDLEKGHQKLDADGSDPELRRLRGQRAGGQGVEVDRRPLPGPPGQHRRRGPEVPTTSKGHFVFSTPFYGLYGIERAGPADGRSASSAATTGTASAASAWSIRRTPTAPGATSTAAASTATRSWPPVSPCSSSARAARRC